jgi:hypothetical protein
MADAIVYLARGRRALEPDRLERELFVELVCELVRSRSGEEDDSAFGAIDRSAPTGVGSTPE